MSLAAEAHLAEVEFQLLTSTQNKVNYLRFDSAKEDKEFSKYKASF
jgi:hypothetical protein